MAIWTPAALADWDGNGSYEDTLRVMGLSVSRGVDVFTGKAQVSSAQITLKNFDGRYSPYYGGSPLAPNVLPGKNLQITWTSGVTTKYAFSGPIREISHNPAPNARTAALDCVDLLDKLQRKTVTTALLENKRSDELIAAILTAAGYSGATSLEAGVRQFPYAAWFNTPALDAIQEVLDSELGAQFFIDGAGVPTFHARYHRENTTSAVATLNDDFNGLEYRLSTARIYNDVEVVIRPLYQRSPGVIAQFTADPFLYVLPGQTKIFTSGFSDYSTGADCWAKFVYRPSASTDYRAFTQPDGQGTNITSSISITTFSYTAKTVTISVKNNNSTQVAYFTFLQARGAPIVRLEQKTATAEDLTSQATYGLQSLSIELPLETDLNVAQEVADYYVGFYANPLPQVVLTLQPDNDARSAAIADLDLNDRIDVTNALSGISAAPLFVENIALSIGDHPNTAVATYTLGGLSAVTFIILDDAGQDFADLLG